MEQIVTDSICTSKRNAKYGTCSLSKSCSNLKPNQNPNPKPNPTPNPNGNPNPKPNPNLNPNPNPNALQWGHLYGGTCGVCPKLLPPHLSGQLFLLGFHKSLARP